MDDENGAKRARTSEVKELSSARCFRGVLKRFEHVSATLGGCSMKFSAYVPDGQADVKFATVFWLSGLTCTDENFSQKAGAFETAATLGLLLVMPDTSPRGEGVPDETPKTYDFGVGAGFYLNATTEKYKTHYNMLRYVTEELPELVERELPAKPGHLGIMGHSMGGHGALTIALKNPGAYKSVSAFAPICNPSTSPWGKKAFQLYLGADEATWEEYDAVELVKKYEGPPLRFLVDQGTSDNFLKQQLKPETLKAACAEKGVSLTLRMQEGFDHSYFFIQSFIKDHLHFHAEQLTGAVQWCPDAGEAPEVPEGCEVQWTSAAIGARPHRTIVPKPQVLGEQKDKAVPVESSMGETGTTEATADAGDGLATTDAASAPQAETTPTVATSQDSPMPPASEATAGATVDAEPAPVVESSEADAVGNKQEAPAEADEQAAKDPAEGDEQAAKEAESS